MSFKDYNLNFDEFKKIILENPPIHEMGEINRIEEEISDTYPLAFTVYYKSGGQESYTIRQNEIGRSEMVKICWSE